MNLYSDRVYFVVIYSPERLANKCYCDTSEGSLSFQHASLRFQLLLGRCSGTLGSRLESPAPWPIDYGMDLVSILTGCLEIALEIALQVSCQTCFEQCASLHTF